MPPSATRTSPRRFHLLLAFTLTLLGTILLWWLMGGRWTWPALLVGWLVAINVMTLTYYGYDKAQAGQEGPRVPESVLHTLSLAGGSPGAFLAMHIFRHKTMKGRFRILFWCIVVLQAALSAWVAWLV